MTTKKSRTFEVVVKKMAPLPPPTKNSPLVRTGGIKSVARNIAKSKRIGGARGPSA
jgi:hypothetical protein